MTQSPNLPASPAPDFDVFHYQASSDLLNAYVQHKKLSNRHFSISRWSKKLELPTSGIIVNLMKKRRLPPDDLAAKLAESMELPPLENEYFVTLVALERAQSSNSLAVTMLKRRLDSLLHKARAKVLDEPELKNVSRLKAAALMQLLTLKDAPRETHEMRAMLRLPIAENEAEPLLAALVESRVIERGDRGDYRVVEGNLESKNDFSSEPVREFHRESLAHATTALDGVALEKRHFTSYVMAIESRKLPEAKKFIEEFIDEFVSRFEAKDRAGDEIYQLNLNCVPLTRAPGMEH